jgi:hypothetical protein
MAAASLVFPPPPFILSLLPTVTRHTRSVILGEKDTGATGARLPVLMNYLKGIYVQASVCGLLLLRSLFIFWQNGTCFESFLPRRRCYPSFLGKQSYPANLIGNLDA